MDWPGARVWLTGAAMTIADLSVAGLVPTAERLQLGVADFPEIVRWYAQVAALPAWQATLAARDVAMAAWLAGRG